MALWQPPSLTSTFPQSPLASVALTETRVNTCIIRWRPLADRAIMLSGIMLVPRHARRSRTRVKKSPRAITASVYFERRGGLSWTVGALVWMVLEKTILHAAPSNEIICFPKLNFVLLEKTWFYLRKKYTQKILYVLEKINSLGNQSRVIPHLIPMQTSCVQNLFTENQNRDLKFHSIYIKKD